MPTHSFLLEFWDYLAIAGFFGVLTVIGYWSGRGEQASSEDYFLAGKKLPWYVVGGSYIASNISSEQFIGMIGSAVVFGVCVSMLEWANVATFSLLIWFFIPFLLRAKVFTTPEYLELRFNSALRQIFAIVTVISNVVAFLAAVLYGGALADRFDRRRLLMAARWRCRACLAGISGFRSSAWESSQVCGRSMGDCRVSPGRTCLQSS